MPQSYILGKIKRKPEMERILSADSYVYEGLENLQGIEYNPQTLIENEELYKYSNFSESEFMNSFLREEFNSVNFNQITTEGLRSLSYLCSVQDNYYCFQIINTSYFIERKWFYICEPSLKENQPIITLKPFPDVIYDKSADTLYFKKLSAANHVFKGMDQLYREATNLETDNFLQLDFLNIQEGYDRTKVSVPNRKRIAMVMETLSRFSDIEKNAIYEYTTGYCNITFEDGKFRIETDDDLKNVLWGIEQRYFTTPIGGEKRVANSIIPI